MTQIEGVSPWFMNPDAEGVPHGEAADQAAGFAGKG